MKLLLVTVLLLAGVPCYAQETKPTPPPAVPAPAAGLNPSPAALNPALLYWQAIGMLPNLTAAQTRLIPQVLDGKISVLDESVADLLLLVRKSLDRFARAAAVEDQPCVWGTTFDEGPFAPMPQLPKLQLLCRLTLIQAEALFAKDEPARALQSILTAHRAVRHMASDRLLITMIMEQGMEQQIIRITGSHLLKLGASTRVSHLADVKRLPPLHHLREALLMEYTISEWIRHSALGIENSPESEKAMLEIGQALFESQGQSSNASVAQSAREGLASLAEYKLTAGQAAMLQTRLEAICEHPWSTFQTELGDLHGQLGEAPPAMRAMLSGVSGARRKELESATLHTMLEAALTLGDNLTPETLVPYKDAFAEAPLQVKKDDKTITLSTRDMVNGKPLELRLTR